MSSLSSFTKKLLNEEDGLLTKVDDWWYKKHKTSWRVAHWFFKQVRDLPYELDCIIHPRNVVKAEFLDRHYHDTDYLMLHINMQMLVDFIELGKELCGYDHPIYYTKKRYTNVQEMFAWIEDNYHPDKVYENWGKNDCNWDNEEYRVAQIKWNSLRYNQLHELLFIYNWYKNVWPKTLELMPYIATRPVRCLDELGLELDRKTRLTVYLKDGTSYQAEKPVITFREWMELEAEQDLVEDIMLERLIRLRRTLWN